VSRGGATRLQTGTPIVAEIQMAPVVEFRRRRANDSPYEGRAFTLGASLVLHQWLVGDKRGKNPKASKREGCEMIIGIRWRVNL
jgi:hypothetical protein